MAGNEEGHTPQSEAKYKINPKGIGYELLESMKRCGDKISQIEGETGKTETYDTLLKRSIRLALRLKEKNLQKTDIISVCSTNHVNICLPLIAASFIYVRYSPLDPTLSIDDLKYFLNLLKPKVFFIIPEVQKKVQLALKEIECDTELILFDDTFEKLLEKHEDEDKFEPVTPHSIKDTWAIHFSSGSSGFPKGICLSQYSLLGQITDSDEDTKPKNAKPTSDNIPKKRITDTALLYYSPLYWISGTHIILSLVKYGLTRIVYKKFDIYEFWNALDTYKVTHVFISPTMLSELAQTHHIYKGNTLIMFIVSGAKVHAHHINHMRKLLPNVTVCQGYGMTEAAGAIACAQPEDINIDPASCGLISSKFGFKIVDPETDQTLPLTESGELRLKTPFIFNGYYKSDASEAFDKDGWFKTGDIVRFDDDKNLYLIRRCKDLLKYKGYHLSSVSLEEVVLQHPAVKQAAIVGVYDETDGEHPVAVVVLKSEADPEEIRRFVDERVNEISKLRGGVKIVDHLPKTGSGKVNRPLIQEMINSGRI